MSQTHRLITPILIMGSIILLINFAIRASFGVFQIPIANEFGWAREEFSLALAIQNLAWGIGQPIFGAIADKLGDRKAIILGALVYAAGLVLSAFATLPEAHQVYEVLVGFGIAGTGFGVILAIIGRASSDEHRSMSLAIATAAGSAGQVVGPLLAQLLLSAMPWQTVFLVFAGIILATLLLLPMMRVALRAPKAEEEASLSAIVGRAMQDSNYILIFLGFFSCGYQLGFMTAHFPAFITEACGAITPGGFLYSLGITSTSTLGAAALSVIGLTNIAGTLAAGYLGNRYSKKNLLAAVYLARALVTFGFISFPITPLSVLIFSALMGMLWLATVPLTSGLVAYIFGLRYMGTLYGIVFFSHQLGSFIGIWLGGRMFDVYGSYTVVWLIGVGVGLFSALVHLPIREKPTVMLVAN